MTKSCVPKADATEDGGWFQFYCTTHQYGWSIDEDGILRDCPQCLQAEGIYKCDHCGEDCDELIPIDDSKPLLEVCRTCLANPRTYEDRYAAKVDRDYERLKEEGF